MTWMRPLVSALALAVAGTVAADIRITGSADGTLTVATSGEQNQDVLESLGTYLGFTVEILDRAWAEQKLDFNGAGEPESVIRSLLAGTSTLIAYGASAPGSRSRIAAVTVLSPGSAPAVPDLELREDQREMMSAGLGAAKRRLSTGAPQPQTAGTKAHSTLASEEDAPRVE